MKIKEYKIISGNFENELSAEIKTLIGEGWQPYGSLQVVCPLINEIPAPAFYQTMVRYDEVRVD